MAHAREIRRISFITRLLIATFLIFWANLLWMNHAAFKSTPLFMETTAFSFFELNKSHAIPKCNSQEQPNGLKSLNDFEPWHPNITHSIWTRYDRRALRRLDPLRSPIMPTKPNSSEPLRIRILLFDHKKKTIKFRDGPTWALGDEMLNIALDGFQRSPFFDVVNTTIVPDFNQEPNFTLRETKDIVWVVDMRRIVFNTPYTIDEQTLHLANRTLTMQQQEFPVEEKRPTLRIVFIDYRDFVTYAVCSDSRIQLIQILGADKVRTVMRNVVNLRQWDNATKWSKSNHVGIPIQLVRNCSNIIRTTYSVRSDHIEAIHRLFPRFLPSNAFCSSPVYTDRRVDAAHFWALDPREPNGHLRNEVTKVLISMNNTKLGRTTIRTIGNIVSRHRGVGRSTVADEYIESLLTTKVVVVAQRDRYEDHYRLFESLGSGAMVMTDTMLTLPDGLVDGESIVMYHSLDHLCELLLYYLHPDQDWKRLHIARRGYELAVGQYRSFHLMERIFFGGNASSA